MVPAFLGQLLSVPYTFAPVGWALCNGQTLAISQNDALFSLIGTTFGGDGVTTFNLPDLRGRVPMGRSQTAVLGQTMGTEQVTLVASQMPAHAHAVQCNSLAANQGNPKNNFPAAVGSGSPAYDQTVIGNLPANVVGMSGGSTPHENRQPVLAINWIIALEGIYPSQG